MHEIERYRDELERVFAEVSEEMAELPPGLSERAQALLARYHPLRGGGGANGICYLLPYWYGEQTGAPDGLCRDLTAGNIYMMLHFFLLDDAMDGGGERSGEFRGSLALGQLLYDRFRQRYGRHFGPDSPLWEFYRRYLEEWAAAVSEEAARPMDPGDPVALARKAAPIKGCVPGLLLRAGRPERISDAEQAVELALAVLQLSDDWADWREDLLQSNCNAFLSLVKKGLRPGDPLEERTVRGAIFHRGCAARLAGIAEEYAGRLDRMPDVPARLQAYARAIAQDIRKDAEQVEESARILALEGGFVGFLSNLRE